MDEETLAIKPFKAPEGEKFGVKDPARGQRRCIGIASKQAAPGQPWSWRGCYWDHQPQTEVELLRRGFHIACIYAENPVLRSFMSKTPPLDNLASLARAGVPFLHVCGSLDPALDENTRVVETVQDPRAVRASVCDRHHSDYSSPASRSPGTARDQLP